jgi:hypothetical protein
VTISDFVAFFAMLVVFCGLVFIVIWLGDLPANIARERRHPQVAAVRAMSWLGLLFTGGIVYIVAFIWAFYDYAPEDQTATGPDLRAELDALCSRVSELETALTKRGDVS